MRTIRIPASLLAVFAVSALAAAPAGATGPEYDANRAVAGQAVQTLSTSSNIQGFNGGGVIIACPLLTANTGEEIGKVPGTNTEAINTKTNSGTLLTHPIYGGPGVSEECRGTIGAASFKVEVRTRGCNFRTHAAKPNTGLKTAEVDIVCNTGVVPGIENVFIGLEGCVITVFPQTLKGLEYKNEPETGNEAKSEVTTASEVKGIKSKATSICGIAAGTTEFEAEYREGKIEEIAGVKTAKIAEAGNPAKSVAKGVKPIELTGEVTEKSPKVKGLPSTTGIVAGARVGGAKIAAGAVVKAVLSATEVELEDTNAGGACPLPVPVGNLGCPVEGTEAKTVKEIVKFSTAEAIAGAVGVNETHWYEQNSPLTEQSGAQCKVLACPGPEGNDILAWGKLELEDIVVGKLICEDEFGGDIYNPGAALGNGAGGGFQSINKASGEAAIGKLNVDAFQSYDCTDTECESGLNSKMFVESEGLGVTTQGVPKEAVFGEWEGTLNNPLSLGANPRISIGNETGPEATRIKFRLFCPATTSVSLESKAKGKLSPTIENGTAQGSAPGIIEFVKTETVNQGQLEIGTHHDGLVGGKLKVMGFENGGFISTKSP